MIIHWEVDTRKVFIVSLGKVFADAWSILCGSKLLETFQLDSAEDYTLVFLLLLIIFAHLRAHRSFSHALSILNLYYLRLRSVQPSRNLCLSYFSVIYSFNLCILCDLFVIVA